MTEKEKGKDLNKQEEDNNNAEKDEQSGFNRDLIINIPPDEDTAENAIDEVTYGLDEMKLNQGQYPTPIPNSLLKKLEANTPMTTNDDVINLQQDYLKINIKEDIESGTKKMVASTPNAVDTIQSKSQIEPKVIQSQTQSQSQSQSQSNQQIPIGTQSPPKKLDSYIDKSKSQQFNYSSTRQPNNESPMYSYYNTSQKILLNEFALQNEDSRERANFVKKQPYDKPFDGSNSLNNNPNANTPLMNMNFNFFNKNINDLLNSPIKSGSPLIYQYDSKRDNAKENTFVVDLKTNNINRNPMEKQDYDFDSSYDDAFNYYNDNDDNNNNEDQGDIGSSPQYPSYNMNKQLNTKAFLNHFNANMNKQFPFPEDFNQDFMMNQFHPFPQHQNQNLNQGFGHQLQQQQHQQQQQQQQSQQKIDSEDYIFEKFDKRGWECEKCNNFNFETRVKCNRCGIPMQPKLLWKIRKEGFEKSEDKKKKPLKERQGDWSCPKCRNLNFAFRQICNRCQLPKTEAELMMSGMPSLYPSSGIPNYNPGFNYIDSQNMINGNINIFNSFNMQDKGGLLYPNANMNMNMMKYMNLSEPIGNNSGSLAQYNSDQQQNPSPPQIQSKKSKNGSNQFKKQFL